MKVKVIKISDNSISFDNGFELYSYHQQSCCESHWLSMDNLTMTDFEGLEFDLSNDNFFEKVYDYGIRLKPVNGFPISIPGYGSNNGYYSSDLTLVLSDDLGFTKEYDISDCQDIAE